MASTIKQRLRRFNGTDYDTVHLETEESQIIADYAKYAPAGFGLGYPTYGSAKILPDLDFNKATDAGLYMLSQSSGAIYTNGPERSAWYPVTDTLHYSGDLRYQSLLVLTGNWSTPPLTQVLLGFNYNGGRQHLVFRFRYGDADNWTQWLWLNPPMELGVEYRTMETYNHKHVYQMTVESTNLPAANSDASIAFPGIYTQSIIPIDFTVFVILHYTADGKQFDEYMKLPTTDPAHYPFGDVEHMLWPYVRYTPRSGGYAGVHSTGIDLTVSEYEGSRFRATLKYIKTTE